MRFDLALKFAITEEEEKVRGATRAPNPRRRHPRATLDVPFPRR